jgi:hypothetical protein
MLAIVALFAVIVPSAASAAPPIRHVFIVMLENKSYADTFTANSRAPYLANQLTASGELLTHYYGIGHESLDNYIALISGQGPNPLTQADCPIFTDVLPGTLGIDGQAAGLGCVYPASVPTIANQLSAAGLTWKGYMEDIANSTTASKTCRHPQIGTPDDTQRAALGDQYAARHDPFVYFHSVIDTPQCFTNVVGLDRLFGDLRSAATTPNFSFISPNLCSDGHDAPCVDHRPGGLASADEFLQALVPQILAAPAFRQDGLLIVAFDESEKGAEACCGERAANTPLAGGRALGPGGGLVGAVLLSPYIRPASSSATPYNHYSLLRSVEDLFGLAHLGYAAADGLAPFGADVFNQPAPVQPPPPLGCSSRALPRARHGRLPRGSLIASVRVDHGVLRVSAAHAAVLHLSVGRRALRARRLRACRTYAIRVPHGRLVLEARVRRGSERRVLAA